MAGVSSRSHVVRGNADLTHAHHFTGIHSSSSMRRILKEQVLYAFPRKAWERWCAQCRPIISFPRCTWECRPPSIEPHLSIRSLHLHCHTWAAWHQLLLYAFPRKAWERWCAQCRPGALVAGNVDQFNVNWVYKQRDRPERFQ